MAHDFNYQVGPLGASLTALSLYAERVRLIEEGTVGKVGSNVVIPGRGGARATPYKQYDEGSITLEVVLRYTDEDGMIVHADGAAGHVYENKEAVDALFDGGMGLIVVRRAVPHWGTVDAIGEVTSPVRPSGPQWFMHYEMDLPIPVWKSTTVNSESSSPLVVGGSARVQDASVDFSAGASSPIFTHTPSGATVSYIGTVPAGGARVFPYNGTAIALSGGADLSAFVRFNRDYGLILVPGSNAFTISSGTATVNWADQWKAG
jgi:hypothetical protein